MSHAAGVARYLGKDATRFTPYELIYMATMGGARALDMENEIGSLEAGKKADIVIENVRTTIVNGQVVVEDREVKTIDLDAHWAEWSELTDRVAEFAKTLE